MAEGVQYLRKLDDNYPCPASPVLLRRGDMFPCDKKGNFLGGDEVDRTKAAPPPSKEKPEKTKEDVVANKRHASLKERAKELGIKYYHVMNESTLIQKIAEAEAEAATAKE